MNQQKVVFALRVSRYGKGTSRSAVRRRNRARGRNCEEAVQRQHTQVHGWVTRVGKARVSQRLTKCYDKEGHGRTTGILAIIWSHLIAFAHNVPTVVILKAFMEAFGKVLEKALERALDGEKIGNGITNSSTGLEKMHSHIQFRDHSVSNWELQHYDKLAVVTIVCILQMAMGTTQLGHKASACDKTLSGLQATQTSMSHEHLHQDHRLSYSHGHIGNCRVCGIIRTSCRHVKGIDRRVNAGACTPAWWRDIKARRLPSYREKS